MGGSVGNRLKTVDRRLESFYLSSFCSPVKRPIHEKGVVTA